MKVNIDVERRRVSLDPRDPAFFNDPYPAYRAIAAAAPAVFWEQYGFWCFARHAQVSALLRDRRFGRQILHVASRQQLGWSEPLAHLRPFVDVESHSLLELEPPEHTRLRNLINRAFVSRQIERLAPRIGELANEMIDRFAGRGGVDLLEHFATRIPVIVIAELLGAPREMSERLLDWSHRMVAMYQFGRTRETEDRAAAAAGEFVAFLRGYVEQRRRARTDDLISQLINAESDEGRLTEEELIATCILVLNAGHEATVHSLGNGVKAMLEMRIDPIRAFATPAASAAIVDDCCASTPRSTCSRAMRWRMSNMAASRSGRATRSACFWEPRIAIPSASPIPTFSMLPDRPIRTSHLAGASISASARRWRGSKCKSRCRYCSGVSPG